jgi:hypothetical protein
MKQDIGYVYVIQMDGHSIYKIGRSSNVPRRMSEIGVQLPFPYRLCFAYRVPNVHFTEADLHRDFAWCRKNGEWFELPESALGAIRARLLYIQAEWLVQRVIEKFNNDDLYPNALRRYGRLFVALGRRTDRRLTAEVLLSRAYEREVDGDDTLSAEIVT